EILYFFTPRTMKGKFLHIGAVVLGFIVTVQGAAALGLPHLHDARLAQIDAEEISQGEESRIRFSDTERVLPAIKASPSQQSMSSSLAAAEELSLEEQMVQRMNEQRREQRRERNDRMQRNQNQYQDDQGNQNQNNQNRQDQNRNQNNQRNQNQDRQNNPNNQNNQNQNGWDNGTICPDTDDERCFYPDSQRERCELFGGTYSNGRCSLEDSQWYRDREERRECEDRGGNYINGQCEMNNGTNRRYDGTRRYEDDGGNTERIQCEDQGGVYRNGRCQMNTSHMNDRSNTSNER